MKNLNHLWKTPPQELPEDLREIYDQGEAAFLNDEVTRQYWLTSLSVIGVQLAIRAGGDNERLVASHKGLANYAHLTLLFKEAKCRAGTDEQGKRIYLNTEEVSAELLTEIMKASGEWRDGQRN